MNQPTRLMRFLQRNYRKFERRWNLLGNLFPAILLSVLTGFYIGNMWASIIGYARQTGLEDAIIVMGWLIILEGLSAFIYQKNTRPVFHQNLWILINYLKIGFLLGIFVDAFKVGS
uniref:Hypothetical chloroplast RF20 n=1 Tax=Nephroselmis astigmatica TaxID=259378 RepID=A0A088CIJ4_9CHLO|nr:hypothetical chloroplast RF20 [Nephroselmis astigmatica]AID67740.1 hypothetical chloroplast RF20 [Nephroselmis astigmatica]